MKNSMEDPNQDQSKFALAGFRTSMLNKGKVAKKDSVWLEVSASRVISGKARISKVTFEIPKELTKDQQKICASKIIEQINA